MLFSQLVEYYEKIEATTSRIEMTNLLVDLLKKSPPDIIDKIVYLTVGEIYPPFIGIELGVADKLALRTIKIASGRSEKLIREEYSRLGDVGLVGEKLLQTRSQITLHTRELTVSDVYHSLEKIAKTSGEGAMETKVQILVGLLSSATPKEAKYILRIVTGKLRLGVADMTILDALAILYGGGKETREIFERAYNITSDIGYIAKIAALEGLEGIKNIKISIGRPVRPMLAERLSSAEEIISKIGGKCLAEYKYDGERMQIHKKDLDVMIFSRRQENITSQYPDVVKLVQENILADEAILECEAVAIDPETYETLPFQELMHRKRKHEIEKAVEEYPVNLYFFDILYLDGRDLTLEPLEERRRTLERIVKTGDRIYLSKAISTDNPLELEKFFHEAIENGCEGLVVKSLGKEAIYRAGARGWLWIKYKRDYKSEMIDTVDLVVVGAFYGRGRRSGKYGALLMAAYDPEKDVFPSVCKVGSGFTDEDLEKLPALLEPYKIPHRHARVITGVETDVWFEPRLVLEIIGAEITLSPIHRAGWNLIKEESGLAIRFPRFTGRYRLDKSPEDCTTVDEIIKMYRSQLKKIMEASPT
ncbi:MAG: ATP-dependent DNA ligase [Aigarchaeota archaeon]|nr:ATP-dependent DNA ligase [Aigarchaeota archaeon]MCX8192815.1 ATP-dependent DNA ligase [Nitrososphaeria archaeon]MDW7986059.1 ATP-dependent DNA ligase [Nitrososphaerota archaeon]